MIFTYTHIGVGDLALPSLFPASRPGITIVKQKPVEEARNKALDTKLLINVAFDKFQLSNSTIKCQDASRPKINR
jgi:hypothetical protein